MSQPFAHMVYFTLKDDSSRARERLVAACKEYLSDHDGTIHFSAGAVADADREVNDRDFHVALHVIFNSRQAHDNYQTAARHQQFITENRDNWAAVRVFDADVLT